MYLEVWKECKEILDIFPEYFYTKWVQTRGERIQNKYQFTMSEGIIKTFRVLLRSSAVLLSWNGCALTEVCLLVSCFVFLLSSLNSLLKYLSFRYTVTVTFDFCGKVVLLFKVLWILEWHVDLNIYFELVLILGHKLKFKWVWKVLTWFYPDLLLKHRNTSQIPVLKFYFLLKWRSLFEN